MKYIYLRSSDIAKLTGHNKYEPKHKVINELLSRNGIKDVYVPKSNLEEGLHKLTKSQVIILKEELNLPDYYSLSDIEKNIKSTILYPSQSDSLSEEESKKLVDLKTEDKEVLQTLLNSMKQDLRMRRGNVKENKNLDKIQSEQKITINQRNSKMYTKELYRGESYCLIIRGKVDGISGDTIIETKNRTKYLFNELRDYERVQLECYCFLTGLKKALLTEHYNNESNCIEYQHNEEFWELCKGNIIDFIDTNIVPHLTES